jgi:hypothetical protein
VGELLDAIRSLHLPEGRRAHTTIYELIDRGEIVKVNLGRRSFITVESLDAYVDRLTVASAVGGAA